MRLISCSILLLGLFFFEKAAASSFSANQFIQTCLEENLTNQTKEKCRGFFYGLVSKKQHLLNPPEKAGLVARALSKRTSIDGYNAQHDKSLRLINVCLPSTVSYYDFKSTLSNYLSQTNRGALDVGRTSDLLALRYSC